MRIKINRKSIIPFITSSFLLTAYQSHADPMFVCTDVITLNSLVPNTFFGITEASGQFTDTYEKSPTIGYSPAVGDPSAGGILFPPGDTPLVISASYSTGETAECTIIIRNTLTELPINNCPDELRVNIDSEYHYPLDTDFITTSDTYYYYGGITAVSSSPELTAGTHTVDITYSDSVLSKTCENVQIIATNPAPTIILNGAASTRIILGEEYIELGATASDDIDGDVTNDIIISGDVVDSNTPGSYRIAYDVSDSNANAAQTVYRSVSVQGAVAPVVSINASITVAAETEFGSVISNASIAALINSATALDQNQNILTVSNDAPDTFPIGDTLVTFTATDADGNVGTALATITVLPFETVSSLIAASAAGNTAPYFLFALFILAFRKKRF